jgi:hypothetical protein
MASYNINNAPSTLDMNTIKSYSDDSGGLARSCRYAVMISLPTGLTQSNYLNNNIDTLSASQDLTYLCEATEFPGRGFENLEIRYYGPTFKIPHRSEYMPINMTFLCKNASYEREFFDDWMELINPTTTFNFNFRDDYATIIKMYQIDDVGNPSYAFTLYDCFPILVNPQPVTWGDDNFLRLTVNFTYTKWYRENKDNVSYNGQGLFTDLYGTDPIF